MPAKLFGVGPPLSFSTEIFIFRRVSRLTVIRRARVEATRNNSALNSFPNFFETIAFVVTRGSICTFLIMRDAQSLNHPVSSLS